MITPSTQNKAPPNETKRILIRRFMKASGLQDRLDSGSFLERYAIRPEIGWHDVGKTTNLMETITGPIEALKSAYQKYRPDYQEAYEDHINWEFTEQELSKIVDFLESPTGRHYLEGTWRMEAYTGTNMEDTEAALVNEAVAAYKGK
ncbi:MAG: DUF2059 domain-containing protein [Novosphingobium sp.]|nr:DUF2059 domain-containing protein [Novosphingobium sp.]